MVRQNIFTTFLEETLKISTNYRTTAGTHLVVRAIESFSLKQAKFRIIMHTIGRQ